MYVDDHNTTGERSAEELPSFGKDESPASKLKNLFRNKWVLGVSGLILAGGIALVVMVLSGPQRTSTPVTDDSEETISVSPTSDISAVPTIRPFRAEQFTPEQLEAIKRQSEADKKVGQREVEIKTKYPWFMTLPLRGEKHFVYFDPNTEVFVARLFPQEGDDVLRMQEYVRQQLKIVHKVPVEEYSFDWQISYQ